MGLQVAGATEALAAHLALMWLLPSVNQEVFLEVGQLGEVLSAGLTPKGPLSTVDTQVNLEVGQLTEDLAADVALVPDLPVLPGERVGQGLVPDDPSTTSGLPQVYYYPFLCTVAGTQQGGCGLGGEVVRGGSQACRW